MTEPHALPQLNNLVDYTQQRIAQLSHNLDGRPVPRDAIAQKDYWRKIASNAESIKILAEALETEARKHL